MAIKKAIVGHGGLDSPAQWVHNVSVCELIFHVFNYFLVITSIIKSKMVNKSSQKSGFEKKQVLKFIYSEKATKFCKIFTVDLSYVCASQIYS